MTTKARKLGIHPDLKSAIENHDYETICSFLHSKTYSSDSAFTIQRCCASFIQGWKECEKFGLIEKLESKGE